MTSFRSISPDIMYNCVIDFQKVFDKVPHNKSSKSSHLGSQVMCIIREKKKKKKKKKRLWLACGHASSESWVRVPARAGYFSLQNHPVAEDHLHAAINTISNGTATWRCIEELPRAAWASQQETRHHFKKKIWPALLTGVDRPSKSSTSLPASWDNRKKIIE